MAVADAVIPAPDRQRNRLWAWLRQGSETGKQQRQHQTHPWWLVIWLTGVDYFSTLGYQPGIALLAAGVLSPVATAILVLVTLACALPVYCVVAKRSFAGQGSIAMLETLLPGWWGKLFVLTLIGFAATDFVITMTLSAADAAEHAIKNPILHPILGDHGMLITMVLLALLAAVFLKGFQEAIGVASFVAIPYLVLTAITLAACLPHILDHPELVPNWRRALSTHGSWSDLLLAGALIFPRLALGLSGFETGVTVMPLIKGSERDDHRGGVPRQRVANTRKLLATAAIIMSVFLLASSTVTTLLIPEEEYREGGHAWGRAIAFLAHKYLGSAFGTAYDFSTILILWFAGASAMAGLLNLIPRYLPRLGMAPSWVAFSRPLVLLLLGVDLIVTWIFEANVEKQSSAYATGVLALMLSAAVASGISLLRERRPLLASYCFLIALVFLFTFATNIIERHDGIIIASVFILVIIVVGGISRTLRATELRVECMEFVDEESKRHWEAIRGRKVHLAPYTPDDENERQRVVKQISEHYRVEQAPFAFVNIRLLDNRSEFLSPLRVRVCKEAQGDYVIHVAGAVATANALAYISEQLDPISIFLELSRANPTIQSLRFLLFGQGEVGLLVYNILLRYWEATPEEDVRPNLYLLSSANDPYQKPTTEFPPVVPELDPARERNAGR